MIFFFGNSDFIFPDSRMRLLSDSLLANFGTFGRIFPMEYIGEFWL